MNGRIFLLSTVFASVVVGCSLPTSDKGDEPVAASDHSIVGGQEASPSAWVGTAALYIGGGQACGGTLIAPQWVLTAAHCISEWDGNNGGIEKVVLGRNDLRSNGGEEIAVDRAIQHPSYNGSDNDNDLGLLHLSEPASTPPVKLVSPEQVSSVVPGADATVVGWGNTSEFGWQSDVLREVTVPLISTESCAKSYAQHGEVTDHQVCAGLPQGKKDACQGDSGGPLYQNIDGETVQIGIVSWGIGCARPNKPGVYTRVSEYLSWISDEIGSGPAADDQQR